MKIISLRIARGCTVILCVFVDAIRSYEMLHQPQCACSDFQRTYREVEICRPVAISVQNQLVRATRNVRQRLRSAVEAKESDVPRNLLCNVEYLTTHGNYRYLWTVPKQNHQTLQRVNPVQIDTHAAASLRYIRASMESATSFAVPGSAGIAMGSVGLLAAACSSAPSMHSYWLPIWLAAALVAAALGGSLLIRPSSLRGMTLAGTPIHRFALCLLPSLFAGAILTAVDWYYGNLRAIPGTWLLLYGCALVAASVSTTRTIGVMGGLFIGLSLLAFVLPENLQILALGVGFGGLHILFGIFIGRMGHGRKI